MKQLSYVIKDKNGIHARPAGLLVKTASQFQSDISIQFGEKSANLKKLFALMSLGVGYENSILITAEGEDENNAIEALDLFLQANL